LGAVEIIIDDADGDDDDEVTMSQCFTFTV